MAKTRGIAEWLADRGLSVEKLIEATSLEPKIVKAIVNGQYTASPQQRRSLAAVLGLDPEQIAWGHTTQVDHMYGHGPQFGRSP
jgi:cyanate lyase